MVDIKITKMRDTWLEHWSREVKKMKKKQHKMQSSTNSSYPSNPKKRHREYNNGEENINNVKLEKGVKHEVEGKNDDEDERVVLIDTELASDDDDPDDRPKPYVQGLPSRLLWYVCISQLHIYIYPYIDQTKITLI